MIYAYDQAIQLPVRDIYDTQIMMASINAAKDMYERGQKQMEDFYKNYGDFFSPISSDMDWYENNITGAARNFINELYKNGVDPLKTAEGRSLIQQFIHNVPVGEVNKRKQAAAAAQEYIKARGKLEAEGLWNPEYEKYLLGGRTLEDWDTARDGFWTRTSPGQYKDLNAATYQWFDKLDKSYLRTENGYDYFGVDENAMNKVLASNIPGFIQSGIGGFHYEIAKRQLQAEGIANPSSAEITQRLKRNIIAADSEVLNETRSMNEEAKQALEWKYDRQKMALQHQYNMDLQGLKNDGRGGSGSRGGGGSTSSQQNYMFNLFNMGISKALTGSAAAFLQAPVDLTTISGDAMRFGYTARNGSFEERKKLYEKKYLMSGGIGAGTFVAMLNGSSSRKRSDMSNTVYGMEGDIDKRLYSEESVIGNTLGFRTKKQYGTDRSKLREYGDNQILITPTEEVYTAPFKDGRVKQYVKVKVTGVKLVKDPNNSTKTKEEQEDLGYYYYELQRGGQNAYTETNGPNGSKYKVWSDRWNAAWDDSELGRISDMNSGAHKYLHPETQKINKIYQ